MLDDSVSDDRRLSRRSFLGAAAVGAAGAALHPFPSFGAGAPFEVAMQGYSLKELNLHYLLAAARELGVDQLELYDRQFSVFMSERHRTQARAELEAAGVAVPATYTDQFTDDEEAAREVLEFGRQMGLRFFSCTPDESTLRLLDRLAPEYGVGIALHNPGPEPGKSFVELAEVADVLERFGNVDACVDVGNFARAGTDPVEALRQLRGQVLEVHVKDVTADGSHTLLGDGVIDLPGVFGELREAGFDGLVTLEYGGAPESIDARIDDLQANLNRLRKWVG